MDNITHIKSSNNQNSQKKPSTKDINTSENELNKQNKNENNLSNEIIESIDNKIKLLFDESQKAVWIPPFLNRCLSSEHATINWALFVLRDFKIDFDIDNIEFYINGLPFFEYIKNKRVLVGEKPRTQDELVIKMFPQYIEDISDCKINLKYKEIKNPDNLFLKDIGSCYYFSINHSRTEGFQAISHAITCVLKRLLIVAFYNPECINELISKIINKKTINTNILLVENIHKNLSKCFDNMYKHLRIPRVQIEKSALKIILDTKKLCTITQIDDFINNKIISETLSFSTNKLIRNTEKNMARAKDNYQYYFIQKKFLKFFIENIHQNKITQKEYFEQVLAMSEIVYEKNSFVARANGMNLCCFIHNLARRYICLCKHLTVELGLGNYNHFSYEDYYLLLASRKGGVGKTSLMRHLFNFPVQKFIFPHLNEREIESMFWRDATHFKDEHKFSNIIHLPFVLIDEFSERLKDSELKHKISSTSWSTRKLYDRETTTMNMCSSFVFARNFNVSAGELDRFVQGENSGNRRALYINHPEEKSDTDPFENPFVLETLHMMLANMNPDWPLFEKVFDTENQNRIQVIKTINDSNDEDKTEYEEVESFLQTHFQCSPFKGGSNNKQYNKLISAEQVTNLDLFQSEEFKNVVLLPTRLLYTKYSTYLQCMGIRKSKTYVEFNKLLKTINIPSITIRKPITKNLISDLFKNSPVKDFATLMHSCVPNEGEISTKLLGENKRKKMILVEKSMSYKEEGVELHLTPEEIIRLG